MKKKISIKLKIFFILAIPLFLYGCGGEALIFGLHTVAYPIVKVDTAIENTQEKIAYAIENKTPMKLSAGITKNYYENKTLKEEILCDEQGLYISYKSYYENGKLEKDIKYKDGFPIERKEYYNNGNLKLKAIGNGSERNMKIFLMYDDKGFKTFDREKKIRRNFYNNGALKSSYDFEKEIWINYNEQGIPQTKEIITPYHDFEIDPNPSLYQKGVYSSTYYFDSETGRVIRDENGDEISVNGRPTLKKQEGIFEDYYDNGQLASVGAYKNGQPLGFFAEYQEDGTPIYEKTYARLDTEKSIWDKSTQEKIEQTLYEGKYKIYSPNGDVLTELSYKNGYLDGIQKKYFWNSKQLMYKGTYKNGKKVGTHIYYTTDGKIEKTDTY